MRNYSISLLFILLFSVSVKAQQYCTPDPNACTPDPNVGMCAVPYPELILELNQYVDTVIHFVAAPSVNTIMGPASIDEVVLDNISNIPTGLNYDMDASGGNWAPDPNYPNVGPFGCIRLYGTPTVPTNPTDSVMIDATLTVNIQGLGQIAVPQSISYKVTVQQTTNRLENAFGNVSCYVSATDLHLKVSKTTENLPLTVKITDVYGRSIRQLIIPANDLSNHLIINLDGLSTGVYVAQIQQGEAMKSIKFKY